MLTRLRSANRLETESQKTYRATISLLIITAHIFTSSSIIHFVSFVATLLLFFLVFILTF